MKVLCFGPGAIGSYIGGSLGLVGNPITYIALPETIPPLKENGISVEDLSGTVRRLTRFDVYASAAEALSEQSYDLAVFAVKGFNTDELLKDLKPLAAQMPPVLSLQNGVENEAKIAAVLGEEKVIPCSVCTAISRGQEGAIKVAKLRGIGIAEGNPIVPQIIQEFAEAGLKPKLMKNARGMKWSKMISNLLSNAASAILGMTPAEVYADPDGYRLEILQLRETLSVMKALGIRPCDIPGTPIKALCVAAQYLPKCFAQPLLIRGVGGGRGSKMPSFYIDLHAGRKESEVEFLNGAVVRAGKKAGIPTPVNRGYYEILTALSEGSLPLETYEKNPAKLLADIFSNYLEN